ncbi:hypothetical protein ASE75_09780 [Sphingomonas sp. Leaf17]|uniref:hypothetical protein n=1 Tax=Sphingomonas sp. Leaf17 TaxID=1735683 RepID=UPI0007009504|nr:hypothetical protein [Sphingomonas sp. Leaf17]KQM64270.1 hypothetical protein ASE75_09780 [Sphingomonas sp. Leaf17]
MVQLRPALIGDTILATALALVLAIGWGIADWPALSMLGLPDTDDVMRLQQIRDWIDGQGFADLTQYRLGGGLAMHWTRLADLVPSGLIVGLTPLIGRHAGELVAVIVWPPVLFATALLLVIQITRAVGGGSSAQTAGVVAAIAYPATTIFLPGRIDHHGLQVVLLLAALLAMTGSPSRRRGAVVGLSATASLVVGLETTPLVAAIALVALVDWVRDSADTRLGGIAVGATGGLAIGWAIFAPRLFTYPACDGFTATTLRAAAIAATVPVLLAATGQSLHTVRHRATAALAVAALAVWAIVVAAPACLSPYGRVDPLLRTVWLAQVGEAQSILTASPTTSLGYLGLMLVGLGATLWHVATRRSRDWTLLLIVQATALALACVQMRGAYAGTMLAAPSLAAAIARARTRRTPTLVAAWLISAGILYPIAAGVLAPAAPQTPSAGCNRTPIGAQLAALPPGVVMAPIDLGPYLVAATPHSLVAAPYHRNDAGNLAMYHFYAAPPALASDIARQWRVTYVVACPDQRGVDRAGTTAHALMVAGTLPGWHALTPGSRSGAIFVRDGLSAAPSAH